MHAAVWLLVATFAIAIHSSWSITCMDENNNAVDWLIAYKLPKLKGNANKQIKQGAAYAFVSSSDNDGWKLSSNRVSDTSGTPFANTINPIYANASGQIGVFLYNDQPPYRKRECAESKGHSKGLVAIDDSDNTAIWIVHSVPHFPPANGSFVYPSTGFLYGQHFFCVSLTAADAKSIGTQFQYTRPCYYGVNITDNQRRTFTALVSSALNDSHVNQAPWNNSVAIATRGGARLIHFGKFSSFGADLYSDFVSPSLGVSLRTETWQNDGIADRVNSTCNRPLTVENIVQLNISIANTVANVTFPEQNDHCKWAVAVKWQQADSWKPLHSAGRRNDLHNGNARVVNMQLPFEQRKSDPLFWVCIGDINREISQFKRPGGTLCIYNEAVWNRFNSSVAQTEAC